MPLTETCDHAATKPASLDENERADRAFEAAMEAIPGGLTQRECALAALRLLDQADITDIAQALYAELHH